jgi:transposase
LLTDAAGRPIAVEIVAGNTGDPTTIPAQISKVKDRFRLEHVVLVGDRGMLTDARIREDLRPAGLDWITSLRAPDVQGLRDRSSLQLSLFDERDLAEIADPAFPDERLIVCRNPLLADERARKRELLLSKTEAQLERIVASTQRTKKRLRGKEAIGVRVGKVIEKWKMAKHFQLDITDTGLTYTRNAASIARESALDGFYVLRTSVRKDRLAAPDVVRTYKSLGRVERAFRSMKSVDLHVRPIYHRLESRVRAHIFLCMLAYYVEWHMREALAPLLFDDESKSATEAARTSVVAPARPSKPTQKKRNTRRTSDNTALPVMSFRGLLRNLGTLVRNRIRVRAPGQEASATFDKVTQPTPLQARALQLLRVSLGP